MSIVSNYDLMKHLSSSHASTKLVAKNVAVNPSTNPGPANLSSASKGDGATPYKWPKLEFSAPQKLAID